MRRKSFDGMNCSIARTLEVVGEWWSLLLVRDAFLGMRRFEHFQARLGIARNVLATRLARLVERGVFARRRYQTRPERFEYVLTEKGADLLPVLVALMGWGDRWESQKRGAPLVLVDRTSEEPVEVAIVGKKSGRRQRRGDVRAVPGPGADPEVRRLLESRAAEPELR